MLLHVCWARLNIPKKKHDRLTFGSHYHGHKTTKTIRFFNLNKNKGMPSSKSKSWNKKNKNKNMTCVKHKDIRNICFPRELGHFLLKNSLFFKKVVLFPRELFLFLMKVVFWGTSFTPWGTFLLPRNFILLHGVHYSLRQSAWDWHLIFFSPRKSFPKGN
jgi:hypothetical protein